MKQYKYKARTQDGKLKEGVIRADSTHKVTSHLRESGMTLVSLQEKKSGTSFLERLRFGSAIKFTEIMVFSRQLYALTHAGLPLVSGLKAIEDTTINKSLRLVIEESRKDIEAGSSLSAALAKHPRIFSTIFTSVVKAGETSGTLPDVLQRLAGDLEKEQETKSRIKQAMSYPVIVVVIIVIALLAINLFVLPRFTEIFMRMNIELPVFTKILIAVSQFTKHYWYIVILGTGALGFGFHRFVHTSFGKRIWDGFVLKIVVFGPLSVKIYMSRFAMTIATLLRSGVPIVESLELAGKTTDNIILFSAIDRMKNKVKEGRTISSAMREEPIFPALVIQMISAGEESGNIDELMEMVAGYYERESDYTIRNLTTLIEPFLLMIIAGMVLVLALGIFMPLWNMSQATAGGGH